MTPARENLIGAGWMVGAMAAFAIEDAALKVVAGQVPLWQALVMFGLGGALVFALSARIAGRALISADAVGPAMRLRAAFEVIGRLFYTLAFVLTPLSSATVILQATPLIVVGAAALFMGERVGWRRWTAIGVGLVGVAIVVQPGADSFSALSILAVIGVIGFAGRDLASRAAPRSLGTASLGFFGALAVIVAGLLFALWDRSAPLWPDGRGWGALALAVGVGALAYTCLMHAMRTGDVSAVTPFRYTRLLFGIGLGVVVFGETLTPAMLLGSAVIVAAGVFIVLRGRRRA